tara:strand:- start:2952 stop:3083 length:132 start_codon:yes stop_codon:yes gene_type:complete
VPLFFEKRGIEVIEIIVLVISEKIAEKILLGHASDFWNSKNIG